MNIRILVDDLYDAMNKNDINIMQHCMKMFCKIECGVCHQYVEYVSSCQIS